MTIKGLKYKKEAGSWYSALPLGNGRTGAMVFGGAGEEHIALNLDTLWSGDGRYKGRKVEPATWNNVRQFIKDGNYSSAEKCVREKVLCDWTECFLPAGNIKISFDGISSDITDYTRFLSLNEALHTVSFNVAGSGKTFCRESFISLKKNVLLMKLSAAEDGKALPFSFSLDITSPLQSQYEKCLENEISITGRAPVYAAPAYVYCEEPVCYRRDGGLCFALGLKLLQKGGGVRKENNRLTVSCPGECWFIFSGNTNFHSGETYKKSVWQEIYEAEKTGYSRLKNEHTAAYKVLFDRVDFSLGAEKSADTVPPAERYCVNNAAFSINVPDTLELLENAGTDKNALCELMFHYARYLIISSSMEGSECANLQGIWNKDIRAPWSSNYTVNINTQMNYWFVESVNLPECHFPLFDLMDRVKTGGERTAAEMYNSGGWVSHHNIDIWGHSTPVGLNSDNEHACSYAMWQMSSAWLCRHLWEHFLHTQDLEFLRERAWPLMEGAAVFYLDNLVEIDGKSGLLPSTSPENLFVAEDGNRHSLTFFSTMETSILKDFFSFYSEAAKLLNLIPDSRLQDALGRLPELKINEDGALAEWYFPYREADKHHRHVSHLYGLYPAGLTGSDKDLLEACKVSLNRRGDEGTGWSIAWKACLWARIKDGNRAFRLLKRQLELTREQRIMVKGGGTYPNLFCAHPPFQIDGNFGFAAAVVEMLVQSHQNRLEILPALPDEWSNGEVKGLILRGGYTAGFKWKNGRVIRLNVVSLNKNAVDIVFNGQVQTVDFSRNRSWTFSEI